MKIYVYMGIHQSSTILLIFYISICVSRLTSTIILIKCDVIDKKINHLHFCFYTYLKACEYHSISWLWHFSGPGIFKLNFNFGLLICGMAYIWRKICVIESECLCWRALIFGGLLVFRMLRYFSTCWCSLIWIKICKLTVISLVSIWS